MTITNDSLARHDHIRPLPTDNQLFPRASTPDAIHHAVGWAVSTYFDRPDHFQRMIRQAMAEDFPWEKSARQYLELYERAMEKKPG